MNSYEITFHGDDKIGWVIPIMAVNEIEATAAALTRFATHKDRGFAKFVFKSISIRRVF